MWFSEMWVHMKQEMHIALGEENYVIPLVFENDGSRQEGQVGKDWGQKAQEMCHEWMKTALTFSPAARRGATWHLPT